MVLDLLTAIGLKEAGSYVAKDVLLPLLQGSLEDYAKDFFKGSIADAVGLASQEPVQKGVFRRSCLTGLKPSISRFRNGDLHKILIAPRTANCGPPLPIRAFTLPWSVPPWDAPSYATKPTCPVLRKPISTPTPSASSTTPRKSATTATRRFFYSSKIFQWYEKDFLAAAPYIVQYNPQVPATAEVRYLSTTGA